MSTSGPSSCAQVWQSCPVVKSITGIGLMVGIEFLEGIQAADVLAACREKGLLVLTAKTRLRLLPPLTLTARGCGYWRWRSSAAC